MNRTIELPTALYQRLEKHAAGFHQTPVTVIENVINAHEETMARQSAEQHEFKNPSKYIFNNEKLDKSRLVLKVITRYVNDQEEDVNLYELSQAFPNEIQGSIGIANRYYDVVKQYDGQANKHHFVGEHELLDLQDGKVAISTEWGASNIAVFIKRARELGYTIEVDDGKASAKPQENTHSHNTYIFNNEKLSPSHLVLKVITEYVLAQEEEINLYQLSQAFPNALQGSIGIANKFYDVVNDYDGKDNKQHFIDEKALLDLQDGKVAVCSQWDAQNIDAFVQQARELGFNIDLDGVISPIASEEKKSRRRNKYVFDGEHLGASQLVLKIITDYVNKQEEDINLYQLSQAFPNDLQGPIGIVNKYDDVVKQYDGQVNQRHFVKDQYLLDLQDGKVAICTEWDTGNIAAFIETAREQGYDITIDGVNESLAA